MGQSPFAKNATSVSAPPNRRRSTRIDFVVPIVISGRDSFGQPFREETETITVSAHGASFRMRSQILIGMQLTVENLLEGVTGKAICIRITDPKPVQDRRVVAIQLLVPCNMWGVKDPPADWQFAVESGQPQSPAPVQMPASAGTAAPSPAAVHPMTDLEQRSSELVESVLMLLRRQAAGILRDSLKEFEDRLRVLQADAQEGLTQRSEKTVDDAEVSLGKLRQDMLEQITAQARQAVVFTEDNLRERIAEMFLPRQKPLQDARSEKKSDPDAVK